MHSKRPFYVIGTRSDTTNLSLPNAVHDKVPGYTTSAIDAWLQCPSGKQRAIMIDDTIDSCL
jgi:hypothetical protein